MSTLRTVQAVNIDQLYGLTDVYNIHTDLVLTMGATGLLVLAAAVVLALLPWTDQQILAVDREARMFGDATLARLGVWLPTGRRLLRAVHLTAR